MLTPQKTAAIVVTFNPEIRMLELLTSELLKQGVGVVIFVDNTPEHFEFKSLLDRYGDKVIVHHCDENVGIASAQNGGITIAKKFLFNAVWLFDQDSNISDLSLNNMISQYTALSKDEDIAAIGPTIINSYTDKVELPIGKVTTKIPFCYFTKQIIASGTYIPIDILEQVGLMEDALFIDAVDFEWCWRACAKQYRIAISSETMVHSVGEGDVRAFGIYNIKVASPFRLYYQVRNYLSLIRRDYVPIRWKLRNLFGYIIKYFYFGFFVEEKKLYRENIISGFRDGLNKLFYKK